MCQGTKSLGDSTERVPAFIELTFYGEVRQQRNVDNVLSGNNTFLEANQSR